MRHCADCVIRLGNAPGLPTLGDASAFVKAGDWLESIAGTRAPEEVRELCGTCVLWRDIMLENRLISLEQYFFVGPLRSLATVSTTAPS